MFLATHFRGALKIPLTCGKRILDRAIDRSTFLQYTIVWKETVRLDGFVNCEDSWQVLVHNRHCTCCCLCLEGCFGVHHTNYLTMRAYLAICKEFFVFA